MSISVRACMSSRHVSNKKLIQDTVAAKNGCASVCTACVHKNVSLYRLLDTLLPYIGNYNFSMVVVKLSLHMNRMNKV